MLPSMNPLRLMISPELPPGLFWLITQDQLHFWKCTVPFTLNSSYSSQRNCQPVQKLTQIFDRFESPILQGEKNNKNGISAIFLTDVQFKTTLGNTGRSSYIRFVSTRGFETLIYSPLCFSLLISSCFWCVLFAGEGFLQSNSQHHLVTELGIPGTKFYIAHSIFFARFCFLVVAN